MPELPGTDFLQKQYNLQKSPEVQQAAHRTRGRTGQGPHPQHPDELIGTYLDRLANLIAPSPLPPDASHHQGFDRRERNITMLTRSLFDHVIIKPEYIPASYDASSVIASQEASLNSWITYLTSDDAKYPDRLKYWTFRSVLSMSKYDKQRHTFVERNFKGGENRTISPFPDLNQEALGFMLDVMEQKYQVPDPSRYQGEHIQFRDDVSPEDRRQFLDLLSQKKESFAKLYGWAIDHIKITPEALLKTTDGAWRVYTQGSDPRQLVEDIKGYGTGWCIRGESYAQRYLAGNHLSIFFSKDQYGNNVVPRVVIVETPDGHITEVRGIAEQENLDPHIADVVQRKLEGDYVSETGFQKKLHDVQMLTTIHHKVNANQLLTRDDLIFLYEINSPIEGFGYQRDRRIDELKEDRIVRRLLRDDACVVLAPEGRNRLASDEIAWSEGEIVVGKTQAYIGPLFPGIFTTLSKDVSMYTSFPEDKIRRETITIGGKTKVQLERELDERGFNVSYYAKTMMRNKVFTTLFHQEDITFVRLKVKDFGFPPNDYPTTRELYAKAKEFGLEEPPAEAAIHKRLQYADQPMNELLYVGIIPIMDPHGNPDVFVLERDGDELWLYAYWAYPTDKWNPDHEFLFSLRK